MVRSAVADCLQTDLGRFGKFKAPPKNNTKMVKTREKTQVHLEVDDLSDYPAEVVMNAINNGYHFDCSLRGADGQEIYCHRAVLAASSEFLDGMLQNVADSLVCISIPDIQTELLENIVTLIYSGRLDCSWKGQNYHSHSCFR